MRRALFIASTGQHIGKTTTCLGLLSGLKKRFESVGFMKPVGQEHMETDSGLHVDKDVLLIKEHFHLKGLYESMSPVLVPQGFTRDFLDGKITSDHLSSKISSSFAGLQEQNDFVVIEGTGNMGVGSIIEMNNAQVASLLKTPVVLIASGGLGSAFDDLSLNKALCEKHGVTIAGVILNRVLSDKREMIIHYMTKALKKWNLPLLGAIPYDPFLSNPSMKDFELLFNTTLLTGEEHRLRHFKQTRLVATSAEVYRELIVPNQLIITPANREDIILATLTEHWDRKIEHPESDFEAGMILTGDHPPRHPIVEQLKKANIPMLFVPLHSYSVMKKIMSFTAKIRREDVEKVQEAISLVESHINFDQLLSATSS